ncbi:MAG: glycosyltransferase family 2 protein [Nitrososphaeria archaeon]
MKDKNYVEAKNQTFELPKIVIIVLNWNGLSITYKNTPILDLCLDSILNLKYSNLKVIVVDANSEDGSVSYLKKKFLNQLDIVTSKNIGWAHNNNVGIKYALRVYPDAQYIFLMSNDIIFTDKNWLNKFIMIIPKNDISIGVIGCKLLNTDGTIQNSGLFLNKIGLFGTYTFDRKDGCLTKNEYIVGAFMIITTDCLKNVGYLDEIYDKMGSEDTDFEERARLFGYNVFYINSLNVVHLGSASTFKLETKITNRWDINQLRSDMNRNFYLFLLRYHKFKFLLYLAYDFIKAFIGIKPNIHIRGYKEIMTNLKNLNIEINSARNAYNKIKNYRV